MKCPNCRHRNPKKAEFCAKCGQDLSASTARPQVVVVMADRGRSRGCLWALLGILATMLVLFLLIWFNILDIPPVNPGANLPARIIEVWDDIDQWQERRDPPQVAPCDVEIDNVTAVVLGSAFRDFPEGSFAVNFCFEPGPDLESGEVVLLNVDSCDVHCTVSNSFGETCCMHYVREDLQPAFGFADSPDEGTLGSYEFGDRAWVRVYYSPGMANGNVNLYPSCSSDGAPVGDACALYQGWVDIPEIDPIPGDDCPDPLDIRERIDFSCAGGQLGVLLASSGSRIHEMDYMVMLDDIAGSCSDWHVLQDYIYCSFPFPSAPHYTTLSIIYQEEEACVLHTRDGVWYASAADLGCGGGVQLECSVGLNPVQCAAAGGTYSMSGCDCTP